MPEPANTFQIPSEYRGRRIDQVLAQLLPDYSRATLQACLKAGAITVNQQAWRAKDKVQGGETIQLTITEKVQLTDQGEDIPLAIAYEDDELLVVNKPAGLVVHPGAGNPNGTLVNALLHYQPSLQHLPRAGLIHRIDKDTSGLLVVGKQLPAFHHLTEALKQHAIIREYHAIVNGQLVSGGRIDAPIGRHPHHRLKMTVIDSGKPAISHYRLLEKFPRHTYLQVQLETGRTHQIRVHMAHLNHPLVGDPLYGKNQRASKGASPTLQTALQQFTRQALHAKCLRLPHPTSGELLEIHCELPQDFQSLLQALRSPL